MHQWNVIDLAYSLADKAEKDANTNKLKLETICETQLDNYTSEYFITGVLEDP